MKMRLVHVAKFFNNILNCAELYCSSCTFGTSPIKFPVHIFMSLANKYVSIFSLYPCNVKMFTTFSRPVSRYMDAAMMRLA